MKNKKKFIKVAIDSPAAAGAGTLAKSISKYYNLLYLDTGKIYRMIAFIPPKITLLLHCAEPLFSKNLIGFKF